MNINKDVKVIGKTPKPLENQKRKDELENEY